jgi:hypothetical protein
MALLVAAVILVGLLGLLNLVFALGVIRRLREHTEILNRLGGGGGGAVMSGPGSRIGDFSATTVAGEPVSSNLIADGGLLVGFFSIGCEHCTTQLPRFVERSREHPGGRDRVFAVVVADESQDPQPYLEQLAGSARVALEEPAGPVAHAFDVQGFPAFALVDADGVVLASASDVAAITARAVNV